MFPIGTLIRLSLPHRGKQLCWREERHAVHSFLWNAIVIENRTVGVVIEQSRSGAILALTTGRAFWFPELTTCERISSW